MVAAHAWDLRGTRALGLRTAYVAHPEYPPHDQQRRVITVVGRRCATGVTLASCGAASP